MIFGSVKIVSHRTSKQKIKEGQIWKNDSDIGWSRRVNYPLFQSTEKSDDFEKIDRELLVAEYAVCYEISSLGGTVIDNGCGIGRNIQAIIEFPKNNINKIYGLDISRQLLEIARKRLSHKKYSNKIELHLASMTNLSFIKNGSIDFAIAMYRTFGNLREIDRDKNLMEVKKKLKTGGVYILSLGNRKYQSMMSDYFQKFNGPPKLNNFSKGNIVYGDGIVAHYYTPGEIKSYFSERGFIIQRLYKAGTGFIVWLTQAYLE